MTDTITTAPEQEQQPTELNTPWSLHFDRDGTEDYGVICDAEGNDLVASHLAGTSFGDRTFETGTFWLPEKNDPTPLRVRQMQLMTAAPKLLAALESMVRWTEIHGLTGFSTGNAPSSRPTHLTGYEQTSWNR